MMQLQSQFRQWVLPMCIAAVTSIVVSLGMIGVLPRHSQTVTDSDQAVYHRVIKTGVLRCAYLVRPPNVIKDPNTGHLSGIVVDLTNEMGKRLGLKVEWVEEVSWGTMIEGLNSGRYDLVASAIWANSSRGRAADFSVPMFYTAESAFMRSGDKRFLSGLSGANNPAIRIATMDGEMSSVIASTDFPNATTVSLPQFSDTSQLLLEVASEKADLTFADTTVAARYMKHNPGQISPVPTNRPLRILPNAMMFQKGQYEIESTINSALTELILGGMADRLIKHYDEDPDSYFQVAPPYTQNHAGGTP